MLVTPLFLNWKAENSLSTNAYYPKNQKKLLLSRICVLINFFTDCCLYATSAPSGKLYNYTR